LARDVAGWEAVRAVEFARALARTPDLDDARPGRARAADLRRGEALDRLGGPFDEFAHTADVRGVDSPRSPGRYNLSGVGLFVWRLRPYPVTDSPAYNLEDTHPHSYTFSPLGNATPLYARGMAADEPGAGDWLPVPIRRRALARRPADYYGEGQSLAIWAPSWPREGAPQPVPVDAIVAADLTRWHYRPPRDRVAVDPELGRIAFPPDQLPRAGVRVAYWYGFSGDLGGGEYDRPLAQHPAATIYPVGAGASLHAALERWRREDPLHAVIEIAGSRVHTERLRRIDLRPGQTLQVRAADRARPALRLLDYDEGGPDALRVRCAPAACFILDGILVAGRGLAVDGPAADGETAAWEGDPANIVIRHSTLVPGWTLRDDGAPHHGEGASLELADVSARVTIAHSIVGSIRVEQDDERLEPVAITVADSIVDAATPDGEALGGAYEQGANAVLTAARSTVIGRVLAREIARADNCIFTARVEVERRQRGWLRFCSVPPGSRTPRRYHCQPDLAEQAAKAALHAGGGAPSAAEVAAARRDAAARVRPDFVSTRYGTPTYCRLADTCAEEIRRGADDESELGVYHDLFQPQREANLRTRLAEYTPAGAEAGIVFVS
ncbi:MAG TPA: hypothetical protein VFL91_19840, partial [Thermomicrobiales bacterium]|nr:hypothetical protein [Thermomicrobiales bacterium]